MEKGDEKEKRNEKPKLKQKYKDIYGLLGVTEIDIFIAFSKTEYISKFSTNPCGKIGGSLWMWFKNWNIFEIDYGKK